jgi:hypothetical protein
MAYTTSEFPASDVNIKTIEKINRTPEYVVCVDVLFHDPLEAMLFGQ